MSYMHSNIYENISKKEIEKGIHDVWKIRKNITSQAPSSSLHFEGWIRYFRHRHSVKHS